MSIYKGENTNRRSFLTNSADLHLRKTGNVSCYEAQQIAKVFLLTLQ